MNTSWIWSIKQNIKRKNKLVEIKKKKTQKDYLHILDPISGNRENQTLPLVLDSNSYWFRLMNDLTSLDGLIGCLDS
jgi:hypothetical protein